MNESWLVQATLFRGRQGLESKFVLLMNVDFYFY